MMAAHHDIFMDGRTATCTVCRQAWGDCNDIDVRNLTTVMVCPEVPIRPRACPTAPGANTCWKPECYGTCAAIAQTTPLGESIKSLIARSSLADEKLYTRCSACEAVGGGWRVARDPFDPDRCVYGHILRDEDTGC